jgi:hypothetical protein
MYVCIGHLHTKFHLPLSFSSVAVPIRLKAKDFLYHCIVILNLQDSYQKLQTVFSKPITIHQFSTQSNVTPVDLVSDWFVCVSRLRRGVACQNMALLPSLMKWSGVTQTQAAWR